MTYALAIYLLNQFIGFLSPKFDPELEEALLEEGTLRLLLPAHTCVVAFLQLCTLYPCADEHYSIHAI